MEFHIRKFAKMTRSKVRLETGKIDYSVLEPRMLLAADVNPLNSIDGLWEPLTSETIADPGDRIHLQTTEVELFDLQEAELFAQLAAAPMEFTPEALSHPVIISLPTPDDTYERFEIVEAPIMEAELAARFPDIKTYRGQSLDNPAANVRISVTPLGFNASVLAPDNSDYYIDPYFHLETEVYASYYAHDAIAQTGLEFHEHAIEELEQDQNHEQDGHLEHHEHDEHDEHDETPLGAPPFGNQLRTYAAAVATTFEYTQFHTPGAGASVANGLAAVVTAMNRVTQVYENDLSVRMVLVANNDQLISTSSNDGYTNNNGFAMLSQNQSRIDSVIGNANYDIGHVFSTAGGGIASFGVVGVTGLKAQGVTGANFPSGDPFWIDFVAHEMGHQFGGSHTFNGDSLNCAGGNRNATTAYEPGSGSTIQAYAGICGNDNLQGLSDDFFHSISIDQIRAYVTSGIGNAVSTRTNTSNSIPSVSAGQDYVIPAGTPFELTATGSDADGNGSLTYSWEQRDLGPQQDVNAGDNGFSPIFRAWDPSSDPTRVFPRLNNLINNNTAVGETLPTTNRTLDFRVVVRDNESGSGGVRSDDMRVDVNPTGSPFQVTSQNSLNITWTGGTQETITWDVAGTTSNGINASTVDIFLSTDGGFTFDTVLATAVANNGSHTIVVPNLPTNDARIKVKATGNIFFDINNRDFEILEGVVVEDPCATHVQIGATNRGVAVDDNATGTGYLMYSEQNVFTRFGDAYTGNASHLIAVRSNGGQWQYNNNTSWVNFSTTSGDRLLASVDFSADTVTSLQGTSSTIDGIEAGFDNSDITFTANFWNGGTNAGEFGVEGTFFSYGSSVQTIDIGATNRGVAVADNATGTGYILYSAENVFSRFGDAYTGNATNLIAARFNGGQWQYNNNTSWVNFTPESTDRLLADLDFSADTVNSLQGSLSVIEGIDAGYTNGDVVFTANFWNGGTNFGEFGVAGSFVEIDNNAGEMTQIGPINRGVAVDDAATGSGYIMYSDQNVFSRFGDAYTGNASHLIAVRFNGGQWQYNNNTSWVNFTTEATDRLLAEVDFSADSVNSLQGTSSTIEGIEAGYSNGDIVITANFWNGGPNPGEFGVTGTFFEVGGVGVETTAIGAINRGVAVADNATGTGYIMYSAENVFSRFDPYNGNATNLIAVRLNGSQWQYNDNTNWVNFTPESTDRLLAETDFSADTVTSLQGTLSTVDVINSGYSTGDLVFTANFWNGSTNFGEFGVTGTFFEIANCSAQERNGNGHTGSLTERGSGSSAVLAASARQSSLGQLVAKNVSSNYEIMTSTPESTNDKNNLSTLTAEIVAVPMVIEQRDAGDTGVLQLRDQVFGKFRTNADDVLVQVEDSKLDLGLDVELQLI